MKTEAAKLKVLKKLAPSQPGAKKLAQKYGDALVCVRHRTDAIGRTRFTTVELLVERVPIKPRTDRIVGVKIDYNERALQSASCHPWHYRVGCSRFALLPTTR